VGKEARSLDNNFMFRESEKILKKTPKGFFFIYPCMSEKEIKFYPITFSCFCEHEKEQSLRLVCPHLGKLVAYL
jgi:hypothetical protein